MNDKGNSGRSTSTNCDLPFHFFCHLQTRKNRLFIKFIDHTHEAKKQEKREKEEEEEEEKKEEKKEKKKKKRKDKNEERQ